jgi:hypothetical protein
VTKGKGMIVSGGALTEADLRAPRDISNLQAAYLLLSNDY